MEHENILLTAERVGQLIGVSRGRVYQMIEEGALPGIKLSSRRVRVPRIALERWLATQVERSLARTIVNSDREVSNE
jgi:excisionase family DNA binding protein